MACYPIEMSFGSLDPGVYGLYEKDLTSTPRNQPAKPNLKM